MWALECDINNLTAGQIDALEENVDDYVVDEYGLIFFTEDDYNFAKKLFTEGLED